MAARESRFIQCVIEALCDSIGIERPTGSAPLRGAGRGCAGAGRGAIHSLTAVPDDRAIVVPRPGGWYELPAYVRRGIEIPGVEPLVAGRPGRFEE